LQVRQDEELTKLDGKRRGTSVNRIGMREMRWVLRDATRRKAEKRAMKEAEAKGQRPPHDVHKVKQLPGLLFRRRLFVLVGS